MIILQPTLNIVYVCVCTECFCTLIWYFYDVPDVIFTFSLAIWSKIYKWLWMIALLPWSCKQQARKSNPILLLQQMRVSILLVVAIMMVCLVVGSAAPQRLFSWSKFFKRRNRLRPRGGRGRGCTDAGLGIVSCRWSVALVESPRVSHQDNPRWLRSSGAKRSQPDMRSRIGCRPPKGPGPPEDLPVATPFVVYLWLSDADLAHRVRSLGGCRARAVPIHICHKQKEAIKVTLSLA